MTRRLATLGLLAALLAGCASPPPLPADPGWPHADLLLLGEQHDAAEHHRLEAALVRRLTARQRLAALALEMADQGHSTHGLPTDAGEADVRVALGWDERGWPWADYGPAVMAAVRAGVPVVGANLPRAALRPTMRDAAIDTLVDPALRAQLQDDVRDGHCGLLPDSQLPAMTRVQIGRDRAMAETVAALRQPGRVVLLMAGANHVDARRGVPVHLRALVPQATRRSVLMAAGAAAGETAPGYDDTWPTPAMPSVDHCAELRERSTPRR